MAFNLVPSRRSTARSSSSACCPARYWPTYLRIRPYTMTIVMGWSCSTSTWATPGRITVAFQHLYNWWEGVLIGQ